MSPHATPSLNPHLTQVNPHFLPGFLLNYRPLRLPLLLFWVQGLLLVVEVGVCWTIVAITIPLLVSNVSVWQSPVDADAGKAEQAEEGAVRGERGDVGGRAQIGGETNGSGELAYTLAAGSKDVAKSDIRANTDNPPDQQPVLERFACIGSDPTDVWRPRLVGLALWAVTLGLLGPQVCAAWDPLVRVMWEMACGWQCASALLLATM